MNDQFDKSTSTQAYYEIRQKGLLKRKRLEAFEAVYDFGPGTAGEIHHKAFSLKPHGMVKGDFCNRLKELRQLGVVEVTGQRPCNISKQSVNVWVVTGRLPVGRISKKELGENVRKMFPRVMLPKLHNLVSGQWQQLDDEMVRLRQRKANCMAGAPSDIPEETLQLRIEQVEAAMRELREMLPYLKS